MLPNSVHYYYDYCNFGGVTSILKQRFLQMRRRGLPTPIVLNFQRDLGGRAELESVSGVTVRFCPTDAFRPWCAEMIAQNRSELHILIDQPEVVHLLGPASIGIIYEVHTSLEQAFRRMRNVDFKYVSKIICPSEWLRKKLEEVIVDFPQGRVRVCPNFVDTLHFRPMSSNKQSPSEPLLLWVGKLNADKNLSDAFEILKRLAERFPVRPVFVTGGGTDRPSVTNFLWRLQALGLGERAIWINNISNIEMPKLLANVRNSGGILLSTSKFESFGLAVLEAMSCGVPVVAAGVGGLLEVVRSGVDGYLYPLTEPEVAVQLATDLLGRPESYSAMSTAAIKAAARFSAERTVGSYVAELELVS